MSNKKISQLTINTNPAGSDVFPIVNNGETKKLSLSGLTTYLEPILVSDYVFTGGTVTGATTFSNGLNTNSISATTYLNLPVTQFTGGTINNLTANTITASIYYGDGSQLSGITGISSYIEVSYNELYSLYTGNTLTIGQFYLITDFQTFYDQPDFDQNGNSIITDETYKSGSTEPLLVLAIGENALSSKAYSTIYPFDEISYDINFTQTERTNLLAKGRITERIDNRGNKTDYDFRTILFKRYNFYYSENIYFGLITIDENGNVTGENTSFTNLFVPGDILGVFDGIFNVPTGCFRYYEILTVDSNSGMTVTGLTINSRTNVPFSKGIEFFSPRSFHRPNIASNSGSTEFYTFESTEVYNVKLGNYANIQNQQENPFLLSNNVFLGSLYNSVVIGDESCDNTFDDDMNGLSFGMYSSRNIITNDFDRNTVGNYFRNNIIICDMSVNQIGNYFQYNMLGDNDGSDFDGNKIGNFFESNFISFANNDFTNNSIGDNVYSNIIDGGFQNNTIVGNFYDNKIYSNFNNNSIGYNFYGNKIYNGFNQNQVGVNSYGNDVWYDMYDNKIGNDFYLNTLGEEEAWWGFYRNNIQNEFKANNIQNGEFYNNTIGNSFMGNDINDVFYKNIIGNNCFPNIFSGQTYQNTIGNDFQFNNFEGVFAYNTIGHNFNSNTILDGFGFGFGEHQGNKIGNNFYNNTIGEYFYNNIIPDNFYNNTIGNYFQWNTVNTYINGIDFGTYYGNIITFTNTSSGTTATDGIYTDVEGTTDNIGLNARFNIEVGGGSVVGISATTTPNGRYYNLNDIITISGTSIGGLTPDDDVIVMVTGISTVPSVYETYTTQIFNNSANNPRLSYYDGSDILTITNINV